MRNALSKINYIILSIGSILIITGYVLMSGEGSTPAAYNPDIFSRLRICFAPIICLLGLFAECGWHYLYYKKE